MRNLIYFIYSFQNSNYPTGYLPTTANTCTFTVNKVNDNICQLRCRISFFEDVSYFNPCRLDFETFSGLATSALGTCSDSLAVVGMSGYNPPTICGTNTGYHSRTYVCFVFVCLGLFVSVDTTLQPFVALTLDTTVRLYIGFVFYFVLFYLFLRIRTSLHLWDRLWITKFPFHPTPTFDVKLCCLFNISFRSWLTIASRQCTLSLGVCQLTRSQ